MFKKAMELYENCGVNVTFVTENKGLYRFYNTDNKGLRQVFEEYSKVLDNSPESFHTEVPVPDEGHATHEIVEKATDVNTVEAVDVNASGSLGDFLDSRVDMHMKEDALKRKFARKQARKVQREKRIQATKQLSVGVDAVVKNVITTKPLSVRVDAVEKNASKVPSLEIVVSKSVEAVRRKTGVGISATKNVFEKKVLVPEDTFPSFGNSIDNNDADDADVVEKCEKKKKKRKRHVDSVSISGHLLAAVDRAVMAESLTTMADLPLETPPKPKRMGIADDPAGGASKKKKKKSQHIDATKTKDTTAATEVLGTSDKMKEEDICNWFNEVETSMMMDAKFDKMPTERNDPIFARLARA